LGKDINQQAMAALKHIGIVFQQQTLEPSLSVLQNLQYYSALQGLSKLETSRRIEELLEMVRLSEQGSQTVSKLSGGQKRRVELARALLHSPDLLLMDEATTGLDVKSRYDFIAMIRKLCSQQNVSVLWATHLVDEVLDSDPVTILHEGKVMADSHAEEIIRQQGCGSIQAAFLKITRQADPGIMQADLAQVLKQQDIKPSTHT
jgi:ABC-2 type transport system ATP-binding protein